MKQNKLSVGVVTFNRLELLKVVIDSLRNQTVAPDQIFVINNSSTDGTEEWLKEQKDLIVVKQDNVGSSGGQYTNLKSMYDAGFEWLWIMDDDVAPDSHCIENLTKNLDKNEIRVPLRYGLEGTPYYNDTIDINLSSPFKTFWTRLLSENDLTNEKVYADGITFEGPLFHRSVVEKIGLPDKKFFIYGDDTEYMVRAKKAGFKPLIMTKARLNRMLKPAENEFIFTWKHYYVIRNIIAIDVMHGSSAVRVLRPLAWLFKWLGRSKSFADVKTTIKAFKDGYFYKQEQ
jgi:GT2 family glycosyltransferase